MMVLSMWLTRYGHQLNLMQFMTSSFVHIFGAQGQETCNLVVHVEL